MSTWLTYDDKLESDVTYIFMKYIENNLRINVNLSINVSHDLII